MSGTANDDSEALDILDDDDAVEPPSEIAINATVDATPVVSGVHEMSPAVLWAFCVDIAQNIDPYDVIAARYGFADWERLQSWLITNDAVRKKIKELRAIWQSDDNVAVRARTLAGHSVLAALPHTARIMLNERLADNTRLEALKMHARIAGVDNAPGAARGATEGVPGGGRFSVNIIFPNAGTMESITTIDQPRTTMTAESE